MDELLAAMDIRNTTTVVASLEDKKRRTEKRIIELQKAAFIPCSCKRRFRNGKRMMLCRRNNGE